MSVRIPIYTDPTQTVGALDRISQAIEKTGQEGKKFAEIDFSHPELQQFAEDAKQLQSNFEELLKVGRGGTAAAIRAGEYEDVFDWNQGNKKQFPNENERIRHQRDVTNYVSQGTSFEKKSEENQGGGFMSSLPLPGMGGLLKWALGIAGITKATSMISEGVQSAQQEATGIDTLSRATNDLAGDFNSLKNDVRAVGSGLQLTYNESIRLSGFYAKASGLKDHDKITSESRDSAAFARSFGLNPDATAKSFGQMRWMGAGGEDRKQFAVMLADAINSGGMWAKADEVISSVAAWIQESEGVMVNAPNVEGYLAAQSAMNASNQPGLQGAAGATVLSRLDTGVRQPGFGEAGMNFMWRALSRGGNADPSSSENDLDPFQLRYLLEEGAWGSRSSAFGSMDIGLSGSETNFEKIMNEMNLRYEGRSPMMKADALSNLLGLSMHQSLALSNMDPSSFGSLGKMLKDSNVDLKSLNMTGLKEMGNIDKGSHADLIGMRDSLIKDDRLRQFEVGSLERAETKEELKQALIKITARLGREETEGTKSLDAMVQMKDELTRVGDKMLGPLIAIQSSVGGILNAMNDFIDGPDVDTASQSANTGGRGDHGEGLVSRDIKRADNLGWEVPFHGEDWGDPERGLGGVFPSKIPKQEISLVNTNNSSATSRSNDPVAVHVKLDMGDLKVIDSNGKTLGRKKGHVTSVVIPLPEEG